MRNGTNHIAFDFQLTPPERLLIATFIQAKMDLLSPTKRHRLGAELFLRGCGFEPDKVRNAAQVHKR